MSFQNVATRKANKEHKCDICNKTIKKGEKYRRATGRNEDYDGFYDCIECMDCQPIIQEYCDSTSYDRSEGYCDEYIQEWWLNEKCYECKHRYLPCEQLEGIGCPTGDVKNCDYRTKYGTCNGGDTCDEMTRYSWCEKYEKAD
jgi:hypothetical protein